jgi:hypothetical protein
MHLLGAVRLTPPPPNSAPLPVSTNSFQITSLADPHPLTPMESHPYERHRGVRTLLRSSGRSTRKRSGSRPFLFMHLRIAPLATPLFSNSCKMMGGVCTPCCVLPISTCQSAPVTRHLSSLSFQSTCKCPICNPCIFKSLQTARGVCTPSSSENVQPSSSSNFQACGPQPFGTPRAKRRMLRGGNARV